MAPPQPVELSLLRGTNYGQQMSVLLREGEDAWALLIEVAGLGYIPVCYNQTADVSAHVRVDDDALSSHIYCTMKVVDLCTLMGTVADNSCHEEEEKHSNQDFFSSHNQCVSLGLSNLWVETVGIQMCGSYYTPLLAFFSLPVAATLVDVLRTCLAPLSLSASHDLAFRSRTTLMEYRWGSD